jgi:glutamyl-tRNA synthetase
MNPTRQTDEHTTRLAPSPTGALHLGNARTFLANYLLARQSRWRVLMRIEDLDSPRTKPWASQQALEELSWLGMDWESPVLYQSARRPAYQAALDRLIDLGVAYPCVCSRKDVELASSAPHAEDHQNVYPNTCRGRFHSAQDAREQTGRPAAWRVRTGDCPITIPDEFCGPRSFDLRQTCGDFVVFRNNGVASYQLAVVIDDADTGVDAIVRGDDLLESAARQVRLRQLLNLAPEPRYWHLSLVVGSDGLRLAKRHGDTRLDHYRERGTPTERILGLMGYWLGALDRRQETDLSELIARFDPVRIPRTPVTFTPEDDRFLLGS